MTLNCAMLIGNLGADPEVRRLNNGKPVVSMRIATTESWRDKDTGDKKERTEWHSVVIFSEGLCGIVEKYCHKGSKVFVQGKMQTRKWTAQDGQERYTTEVVLNGFDAKVELLGSPGGGRAPAPNDDSYGADRSATQQRFGSSPSTGGGRSDAMDDDIPFAPEMR